jgi:hypothetical protein
MRYAIPAGLVGFRNHLLFKDFAERIRVWVSRHCFAGAGKYQHTTLYRMLDVSAGIAERSLLGPKARRYGIFSAYRQLATTLGRSCLSNLEQMLGAVNLLV